MRSVALARSICLAVRVGKGVGGVDRAGAITSEFKTV
jgi:hypothetical protein